MIGKKIQNYEIISLIGEGGMGNVYLAENKEVGRRVAIKIILPHLAKHEHVRDRFIIEAKTMSRLQHVNIITLYDYIANDEGLFLIMEYVDGDPLDDYIHNIGKAIDEDLAIEVTKQVLSACDHAHANGVVHRDIKPGNIIINKEGTVKILDFGIAKIIDEEVSKLTKTGLQIGTVYYMSPEQVQGGEITAQTDIYSIGVTLYQMVTAINPYKQESTEFQIYKKIVGEPLPDVREIDPTLSPFIHEVIQKATKKNPSDRFKNCQDFSEMLEKKDENIDVDFMSPSGVIDDDSSDQKTESDKSSSSRPPFILGGSILSILLALTGLIVCFLPFLGLLTGVVCLYLGQKYVKRSMVDLNYIPRKNIVQASKIISIVGMSLSFLTLLFCTYSYINRDSDGDGLIDRRDECPYEFGNVNGCPDWDGDGTIDMFDECMRDAGDIENNGCPDSDDDGLFDFMDECPSEFGPRDNNGCPWTVLDEDGDGVSDNDDICPDEFGPEENEGCPWPDSDMDGVSDNEDLCPDEFGPEENEGCPWSDSDYDGVFDKDDNCPYLYGNDEYGCPRKDSDKDGVLDIYDDCPYTYGTKANGCPSTTTTTSTTSTTSNDTYKKIMFTNNSSVNQIDVAVCYWNGTTWVTEGWFNIRKGKSVNYSLPKNYSTSRFYFHAFGGGYTWTTNGISKCVSNNAFTYYDNVKNSCPDSKKFEERAISGTTTYVTFGD